MSYNPECPVPGCTVCGVGQTLEEFRASRRALTRAMDDFHEIRAQRTADLEQATRRIEVTSHWDGARRSWIITATDGTLVYTENHGVSEPGDNTIEAVREVARRKFERYTPPGAPVQAPTFSFSGTVNTNSNNWQVALQEPTVAEEHDKRPANTNFVVPQGGFLDGV